MEGNNPTKKGGIEANSVNTYIKCKAQGETEVNEKKCNFTRRLASLRKNGYSTLIIRIMKMKLEEILTNISGKASRRGINAI